MVKSRERIASGLAFLQRSLDPNQQPRYFESKISSSSAPEKLAHEQKTAMQEAVEAEYESQGLANKAANTPTKIELSGKRNPYGME